MFCINQSSLKYIYYYNYQPTVGSMQLLEGRHYQPTVDPYNY